LLSCRKRGAYYQNKFSCQRFILKRIVSCNIFFQPYYREIGI